MDKLLMGDRIRKQREGCGMSQTFLARQAAISRQQLYMIESNLTSNPGVLVIAKIAKTLRVTMEYLVSGADKGSECGPRPVELVGASASRTG